MTTFANSRGNNLKTHPIFAKCPSLRTMKFEFTMIDFFILIS